MRAGEPPTVRIPDIIITREARVAANPSRLEATDVLVAVEILSPGTGTTDRVTKRHEYANAGIPRYWLVDLDKPVSSPPTFWSTGTTSTSPETSPAP